MFSEISGLESWFLSFFSQELKFEFLVMCHIHCTRIIKICFYSTMTVAKQICYCICEPTYVVKKLHFFKRNCTKRSRFLIEMYSKGPRFVIQIHSAYTNYFILFASTFCFAIDLNICIKIFFPKIFYLEKLFVNFFTQQLNY